MTEPELRARLQKTPKNAVLHHNLGSLLYQNGDLSGALGSFLTALILKPKNLAFAKNALHVLGQTSGYQLPDGILHILARWAGHDEINVQDLSMVVHNQYSAAPLLGTLLNVLDASEQDRETILASDHFDAFFQDALLLAVMTRAIVITPLLETVLTRLRRHVLEQSMEKGLSDHAMATRIEFLAALANQCFNTEYAYAVTAEEMALVDQLVQTAVEGPLKWAVLGAYCPLHEVLQSAPSYNKDQSPTIKFLLKRQWFDAHEEAGLRNQISSLTTVSDETSKKVQQQYERYPYPRWINTSKSSAQSFDKFLQSRFPDQAPYARAKGPIDLLIPGCGTGLQICRLALGIAPARITALDISYTSLAYAKRAVAENGFRKHKIWYYHADILALDAPNLESDYIDCTGVLHHLGAPEKGLAILTRLLRPGGYMRLALYSERGRQDVIKARDYIAAEGFPDSAEGVRDFRQAVLSLPPDHPVAKVAQNQDFYSISGLHDLVFNVNENRYTPQQLKLMLERAGLIFLGFDHMDPALAGRYATAYPGDKLQRDLGNWDRFDQDNPDSFGFMYHFWCRKPVP
ncbi:methyltransferase domain-containing protein [Paremcibacter congregatus]|uniref:class I SAM-dependent methyltransferase n=1 Tax=Paremcibacter congregatus TaxID=2043170 RepID=UPI003A8EAAED